MSNAENTEIIPFKTLLLYVFLPFAGGHYISFIFRSVNAVLAPYLTASMPMTATELGLLSSAYFLSFSIAQLPVGLALDRWGPRRVQLILLNIAAIGSILFAVGTSFMSLFIARVLIGFGLAACFMSSIKAVSYWVQKNKLPTIHSNLIAVGGVGAMSATLPVVWMLEFMTWRTLFVILAVITISVGFLIFLLAPKEPKQHQVARINLRSLIEVYRNKEFQKTIFLLLAPHTVAFGIQGLWMGQWLHDSGGLSNDAVARLLFIGMGAIIIGSLSVGFITQWAGKFGVKPIDVAGIGVTFFVLVQVLAAAHIVTLIPYISVAFTLIGTIAGLQYTIVAQSVPSAMTGRASTCLNLLILFGAFIVQTGFGLIVGQWQPDAGHAYPTIAYQTAFGTAILIQLPGVLYWWFKISKKIRLKIKQAHPA
jgi:predicted MFS family arabinose efflux permease